jgi:ADP-heptose:LPS heptosyltransferase
MKRILVIKLGALGDIFAASSAFEAIRVHHAQDHLTLLTTPPYEDLTQKLGYFDDILLDRRPKITKIKNLLVLRKRLQNGHFDRVYDLQMVDRTNLYYYLMAPRQPLEWVGTAWRCSHRYHLPKTPTYHQERLRGLLAAGGISPLPALDVTRLAGDISAFGLKKPYALLAPGASKPHREKKCWPLDRYASVAVALVKAGLTPVILGGPDEDHRLITNQCPQSIDLTGKTQMMDMITLATHAAFAIGNETGPMHIAAACRCPVLVLFFGSHDANEGGPRGTFYRHLQAPDKTALSLETVLAELPTFISLNS